MRLINADVLPRRGRRGGLVYWKDIENAPTVDAEPVVRCKDCRFYRFYDGTFGKGWMCFENNTARHGDDYCSRGRWKNERNR